MAKYDLKDDGVVVIIGSGAGGAHLPMSYAKKVYKSFYWKLGNTNKMTVLLMMNGLHLDKYHG